MKDGELSSSTKNTKKPIDPADMSLEELLKADLAHEPKPASVRRAAHGRDDEPGSGLVKLAEMVAKSAQDASGPFATISSVPPVPMITPAEGIQVPEATAAPSPVPPPKRSSAGIVFAALIIAAAVLAGFYLVGNKQQPENVERLAASSAVKNESAAPDDGPGALATEVMAAKMAPTQQDRAAGAVAPDVQSPSGDAEDQESPTEEEKAEAEGVDEKNTEEAARTADPEDTPKGKTASAPTPKTQRTTAAKTKRRTSAAAQKSSAVEPPAQKEPAKAKKPADEGKKDGAADLDALLGAPKKTGKPAAQEAEKTQGIAKPNRQQVKKAMTPVTRKAQICSKYSTGTIQLKLVVNNKGRVVSSNALPPFAGTNAGKCVEMLARTAKFPEFSEPSFTVNYPVILK